MPNVSIVNSYQKFALCSLFRFFISMIGEKHCLLKLTFRINGHNSNQMVNLQLGRVSCHGYRPEK